MTDDFEIEIGDIEMNFGGIELNIGEQEPRYIKPPYTPEIKPKFLKYEHAKTLAADIDLSERTYVVVSGNFIFGDFIEALLVEKDLECKRMLISTLSMSQENVDSLSNLLTHGYVDQLDLVVSDYFFAHNRGGLIKYIYSTLDRGDKFQLAVAGSHCKLCLMELADGRKVIIHGSANLRSSGCMEQVMVEESAALYGFNAGILETILEKYKTIEKTVPRGWRGNTLWQAVQTAERKPKGNL